MLATFLFFIFAVFGITEIIIYGLPTKPIRRLFEKNATGRDFIHCPLCVGFWVALGIGFLLFFGDWKIFFLSPFAGAGATYYLHKVVTVEFEPVENPTVLSVPTTSPLTGGLSPQMTIRAVVNSELSELVVGTDKKTEIEVPFDDKSN